jgi:tol-pal system protein YbgF
MKKTLFKVIVYIFCVFSIVELCAEEGMDDLEKKNFFKIEHLEAELIVLKDQYKLLTEQQRLNIQEKSESEEVLDLKTIMDLAAGVYSALNTKINSLNKDILILKNQYELLTEKQKVNSQKQSEALVFGISQLNTKILSLSDDIDELKDNYDLLAEGQKENTKKITELFKIIELNTTKKQKTEETIKTDNEKIALKLYLDGKSQFVLGDYDEAIALFKSYLDGFPNYKNVANAKLWLGRAYFANELYSQSKGIYLEFQSENPQHAKYPDSMYELSRVFFELRDIEASKIMLIKMIEKFPTHDLYKKAKQMLTEFEELTIDA